MSRSSPWSHRLTVPAIAAPMTAVSCPELVIAACRSGVVGAFPTHNASNTVELAEWLRRMHDALTTADAPVAANLVVHGSNARRDADLDCLVQHGVELVITSVGSPAPVIGPLHGIGAQVFADVASLAHALRALDAGVDGLVLLTAGAGGQPGWANPFAFVRAVRERYDGPLVLAGGISDGRAIFAAEALGADLAYLGTRFIATHESAADDDYRNALVDSTLDDVRLSTEFSGIPASLLACWLHRRGAAAPQASDGFAHDRLLAKGGAWSAGHSVSGVHEVTSVAEVIARLADEYQQARNREEVVIRD